MRRNPNVGLYALAIAIGVIGALWLGVPVGDLAILALVLACPLMMIVMMSGMHGGDDRHDRRDRDSHQHR